MYGDYLNMWLLHNIKTMQIYKFTHNPVLLLFVNQPDRVSGRFITNRLINSSSNVNSTHCVWSVDDYFQERFCHFCEYAAVIYSSTIKQTCINSDK